LVVFPTPRWSNALSKALVEISLTAAQRGPHDFTRIGTYRK
jgi:hypothetical protein